MPAHSEAIAHRGRLVAGPPPSARQDRSPLRSFREPNVRIFFLGLWVSLIGTWAHNTAVVLLIRELGGGGFELGAAAACQFGPLLLFGLKAGAIADQVDRHRRLVHLTMAMGTIAVALGLLTHFGAVTIGVILVMTLLFGIASAFENPTRRSFATDLVPVEQVGNVLSLNTSVMTAARMIGPAMAALLAGLTDTGSVFIFNGMTYLAVLIAMRSIDRGRLHTVDRAKPSATPVRDGLRMVWSIPSLRVTLAVFAVVSIVAFNYTVALPLLVTDRLDRPSSFYGWMLSAMSLGNFAGALVVARLDRIPIRYVCVSGLAVGAALAAVATTTSTAAALILVVALGIASAMFVNMSTIVVQQRIDPRFRSRALALTSVVFLGSTPIGGVITGAIGEAAGAVWANLYGAVITIAACGVALVVSRRSRRHSAV